VNFCQGIFTRCILRVYHTKRLPKQIQTVVAFFGLRTKLEAKISIQTELETCRRICRRERN